MKLSHHLTFPSPTELKKSWWLKIRMEEVLVESKENYMIVWTHLYVLKIVFVIITWKTAGQYLGRVWVGVNSSRGLYYWKHMTHTLIRESHKVTKKLVNDFVLFKHVVIIVSVMTKKKIVDIPTLVVISNRVRLRWVCCVVKRTKFNVASDLNQKIEIKAINRSIALVVKEVGS